MRKTAYRPLSLQEMPKSRRCNAIYSICMKEKRYRSLQERGEQATNRLLCQDRKEAIRPGFSCLKRMPLLSWKKPCCKVPHFLDKSELDLREVWVLKEPTWKKFYSRLQHPAQEVQAKPVKLRVDLLTLCQCSKFCNLTYHWTSLKKPRTGRSKSKKPQNSWKKILDANLYR